MLSLGYVLSALVVGTTCTGAVLVLARFRRDELARAFLWFYLPFSVLVVGALLLTLSETQAGVSPEARWMAGYIEAFVGRYGVMLALPLFAHRIFGMGSRRKDVVLVVIVVATLATQHVTEFAFAGGVWDARGDAAEDVLFGAVFAYTLLVAVRQVAGGPDRTLARRFLVLLLLGLPAVAHDVFVVDAPGFRLYPLWYCLIGATMVPTLLHRRLTPAGMAPGVWSLTGREAEVLRLVQRGISNQEIARELSISQNTVKTHLRAIFDKSGLRTRVALIAQARDHPIG